MQTFSDQLLLLVMVTAAVGIGWYLGRHQYRTRSRGQAIKPSGRAHPSKSPLRLLMDSYSDAAIDELVSAMDVNPKTLPIHLSIGRHFRQEGEVDRAILIHQNLLAHPQLSKSSANAVIYELARDYKSAGLFDRAEALLEELIHSREFSDRARRQLISILERQKDWQDASTLLSKWDCKKEPELAKRMAHYHCEMAAAALDSAAQTEAKKHLKYAQKVDSNNVRAAIMLAELYREEQRFRPAIVELRHALHHAPEFSAQILPVLERCSLESNSWDRLAEYLKTVYTENGSERILMFLAKAISESGDPQQAMSLLEVHMVKQHSPALLKCYAAQVAETKGYESDQMRLLINAIMASESRETLYQCSDCGFSGGFYWQCPSCTQWETITAVIK